MLADVSLAVGPVALKFSGLLQSGWYIGSPDERACPLFFGIILDIMYFSLLGSDYVLILISFLSFVL